MAANHSAEKRNGRHAILDLAPLELDCLSVLWPIGEGTVREIREALRENRPRAYTTIMTIMDRMAQKGIVSRRKAGRAWLYSPNVSAGEARERAVGRLVEHFFAGSPDALMAQLAGHSVPEEKIIASRRATEAPAARQAVKRTPTVEETPPAQTRKMDDSLL
jgi:BlaI family penicillinase repressor